MTWLDIIDRYYPHGSRPRQILLMHSFQVSTLALEIAHRLSLPLAADEIIAAAMLHDLGIIATDAPSLGCHGQGHYLQHGDLGASMIRACAQEAKDQAQGGEGLDFETLARVAERHTGAGISPEEIKAQGLPLSGRCHMPETLLEKLICYADKFYSKSASMRRKTPEEARRSVAKFGEESAERFDRLREIFEEK